MVRSDVVFAVDCPLSDLTCGSTEYLLWCEISYHVLDDGVLLGFLKDAIDFRF